MKDNNNMISSGEKKMFRVAICDDTQECINSLIDMIKSESRKRATNIEIVSYLRGEEFLSEIEEECNFDMVFLDIEMGNVNGVDIGKEIYEKDYKCIIFFISHYKDYVYKAFEAHPFCFLSKPIEIPLFQIMFEDAYNKIMRNKHIFKFQNNRVQYQVCLSEVIYFISDKRKASIRCEGNVRHSCYRKLDDIEKEIESSGLFIRIHKSYLINIDHVSEFAPDHVLLSTGEIFGISKDRKKIISQIYLNHFTKR